MSYDEVMEILGKIDRYGMKGTEKVNKERAKDVDVKLKNWFGVVSKAKKNSKRSREEEEGIEVMNYCFMCLVFVLGS